MIRAAGIMLLSKEGRVLMLQRGPEARDFPGSWCFPGGGIEEGESVENAAARECLEETGYRVGSPGDMLCTRAADGVHFTTFVKKVDDEFVPRLDDKHVAWAWVRPQDAVALVSDVNAAVPPPAAPII